MSAYFDGTSDSLRWSRAAWNTGLLNGTDCTMAAWVYLVGLGDSATPRIFDSRNENAGGGGFISYMLAASGGYTLAIWALNQVGVQYVQVIGNANEFSLNTWTHVAFTYDASATTLKVNSLT